MSENEKEQKAGSESDEVVEYVLDDFELAPVSSGEFVRDEEFFATVDNDLEELFSIPEPMKPTILADEIETVPVDPVFEELSLPRLPEPEKSNRARLQMQSPNRLHFYWSIKNNPFRTLGKVFGNSAVNYRLVARLINETTGREDVHPIEASGNWWYNVQSDSTYRAEIGFYAPNRPFVRVIYSNEIETPRKSPSQQQATDADWAISANEFAEVLDSAGFVRDAFEVALAGDDQNDAERATQGAFSQLLGLGKEGFNGDEVRYALLALASGIAIEGLRGQISEGLYLLLAEHAVRLSAENAMSALKDHFEVLDEAFIEYTEEETGEAVVGASLVHFPKRLGSRTVPKASVPKAPFPRERMKFVPRLEPISSW